MRRVSLLFFLATGLLQACGQVSGGVDPDDVSPMDADQEAARRCRRYRCALDIATSSLPSAEEGVAYSAKLTAVGGTAPYTWSLADGALPAGLTLDATTGVIAGTPAAAGTFDFTLAVRDARSTSASKGLSMLVEESTASPTTCGNGCSCPATDTWAARALSVGQSGTFQISFDATPGVGATDDLVIGLSSGPAADYASLAVIVLFGGNGTIDAMNGATGGYQHDNAVSYVAGTSYHFTIDIDAGAHVADYYVTPAGGNKVTLASRYPFRASQASVSQLDTINIIDSVSGDSTLCNVATSSTTPPPPPPTPPPPPS